MGSMLEFNSLGSPNRLRIYLSGDTLSVDELHGIPKRFPEIDAAVLHLGGTTLPGGLLVTMNAEQGADVMQLMAANTTIPVHYDDYKVFKSTLSDFRTVIEQRRLADRVTFVAPGQTVQLNMRK
jgi:L-ascorbate metabolism protein UlaG (beta-lactamase superfamily)